MRKALGVALGAGLLLLLLSALVVAMPQDGAAPRGPQPPSAPPDAVLTAAALPDGARRVVRAHGRQDGPSAAGPRDGRAGRTPRRQRPGDNRGALCRERVSGVSRGGGGRVTPRESTGVDRQSFQYGRMADII